MIASPKNLLVAIETFFVSFAFRWFLQSWEVLRLGDVLDHLELLKNVHLAGRLARNPWKKWDEAFLLKKTLEDTKTPKGAGCFLGAVLCNQKPTKKHGTFGCPGGFCP